MANFSPIGPYRILRPALFKLDPERAHKLSLRALHFAGSTRLTRAMIKSLIAPKPKPVTLAGLHFPHALGMAAGYDKNAVALAGLASMGFGHIEVGTVTPRPQTGQAKPRIFRMSQQAGLINRMGFPNDGMEQVAKRLEHYRRGISNSQQALIGVNIGKNKDTDNQDAASDYLQCFARLAPMADYMVLNVSSPNTPGLRALQSANALRAILEPVLDLRAQQGPNLPLFVKLSPDMQEETLLATLALLQELKIDGVVATNTSFVTSPERGGLSGAPLRNKAAERLALIKDHAPSLGLIACGGIGEDGDLDRYLSLGADLVQVWTALVYRGPSVLRAL